MTAGLFENRFVDVTISIVALSIYLVPQGDCKALSATKTILWKKNTDWFSSIVQATKSSCYSSLVHALVNFMIHRRIHCWYGDGRWDHSLLIENDGNGDDCWWLMISSLRLVGLNVRRFLVTIPENPRHAFTNYSVGFCDSPLLWSTRRVESQSHIVKSCAH